MAEPRTPTPKDGCAWVTGASSGIGRALALRLASDGWTVIATARRGEALADLAADPAAQGRIHAVPGDVTDPAAMADLVARVEAVQGRIALAVLNAGTYAPDGIDDFDPARFRRVVDINLLGAGNCLGPLLPGWRARRLGHLALVASVTGYRGLPRALSYSASKAALIALGESLRFDFQPAGLKVQVINPGFVRTPLTDKNDFPMPFLMEVDAAVERIVRGLASDRFEIAFPRRFAWMLKALRCLPYRLYFPLVSRSTGKRG